MRERAADSKIFFICDNHDPDDQEFQMFPPHCIRGTDETEVVAEMADFVTEENIIPKNSYSSFFNTELPRFPT